MYDQLAALYNTPNMPPTLPPAIRSQIIRLLMLQWRPEAIAEALHCGVRTVYQIKENLFTYGTPFKPHYRPTGPHPRLQRLLATVLLNT